MLIIWVELNLGDSARVLLQVRDEFAGSDFPDAHLALHATRANEFTALGQADGSDATLVSVVDLPKKLTVVGAVGTNAAIRPSTQDDLISEDGAKRVHTTLSRS